MWKNQTAGKEKGIAVFLFFSGLVLGILAANIFFRKSLGQVGILGKEFLETYRDTKVDALSLFFYLLRARMGIVAALGVLGFTRWGRLSAYCYSLWLGFSGGLFLAAAAMEKGFSGILLVLAALLPQYLAYIPGILLLFYGIFTRGDQRVRQGGKREKQVQYWVILLVVTLLFVAGILLETYVNPDFVKKLLKNY